MVLTIAALTLVMDRMLLPLRALLLLGTPPPLGTASNAMGESCTQSPLAAFDLLGWGQLRTGVKAWLIIELVFYLLLRYVVWPQLNRQQADAPCNRDPKESLRRVFNTVDSLKDVYSFEVGAFKNMTWWYMVLARVLVVVVS